MLGALHGTGLLEPPVPHLDLAEGVAGDTGHLSTDCGDSSVSWQARGVPGILTQGRSGVGTKLLDVSISEGSIVRWLSLDEVLLPVSRGQRSVFGQSLGSESLQFRIAFQTRIISQRFQLLLGLILKYFPLSLG